MSYDYWADLAHAVRHPKAAFQEVSRLRGTPAHQGYRVAAISRVCEQVFDGGEKLREALRTKWIDVSAKEQGGASARPSEALLADGEPEVLPIRLAVFVQIEFRLAEPWFARDADDFGALDDPVYKDRTFQLPMIPPSLWRCHLRAVAEKSAHPERKELVARLFGDEDWTAESEGQARVGRLIVYPTFFRADKNRGSTDVSSSAPDGAKAQKGEPRVVSELVPKGVRGGLSFLYFPYDLVRADENAETQVRADMGLAIELAQELLTNVGFSARRSLGKGIVQQPLVALTARFGSRYSVPDTEPIGFDEPQPEPPTKPAIELPPAGEAETYLRDGELIPREEVEAEVRAALEQEKQRLLAGPLRGNDKKRFKKLSDEKQLSRIVRQRMGDYDQAERWAQMREEAQREMDAYEQAGREFEQALGVWDSQVRVTESRWRREGEAASMDALATAIEGLALRPR